MAHWRGQVWVDPARSQLLDSGGLARVKRDKHWNRILVGRDQLLLLASVGDPLCEPLDEIGLVRCKLLLFPAEAATEEVVGETAQAPAALYQSKQIKQGFLEELSHLLLQFFGASSGGIDSTPSSAAPPISSSTKFCAAPFLD